MKYSDTESINKLEEQIYSFELILKVAKFIPFLFGGSQIFSKSSKRTQRENN